MTTAPEAVVLLEQYFKDNFPGPEPIEYDNDETIKRNSPYVKFSVQVADSKPNLDSTFERTVGVVMAMARVLKGAGSIGAWNLASKIADTMKFKTIQGVRLTSASFANVGLIADANVRDAGWYQINVNIPFWFEHYT